MIDSTLIAMIGLLACVLFSPGTAALAAGADVPQTARIVHDFDADWRFSQGDFASASMPLFDDSAWQTMNVPHDWSSDGPFGAEYGSGNGFAPGGIGWYRKHFPVPAEWQGKKVAIEFDGVYDNSEVWINGQFVGRRPYGYSSFVYDLTPFLQVGGENVVAVRVDHSRFADSPLVYGVRHLPACPAAGHKLASYRDLGNISDNPRGIIVIGSGEAGNDTRQ